MDRATKLKLMKRLNRDAECIAARFDLRYRSIEAERANVTSRYGICYEDGVIKIRLRHAVSGESLRYSSLVNTLCHELAHLRHFNHGERFRIFYSQLLEFARAEKIYQPQARRTEPRGVSTAVTTAVTPEACPPVPRPAEPARPVQLSLF